jgi:hypothetical protein
MKMPVLKAFHMISKKKEMTNSMASEVGVQQKTA